MSGRVLVVDDDQSMCEMLELMLRRDSIEVEWRTSGLDALGLIAERSGGRSSTASCARR